MGQEIVYCNSCQTRLLGSDFEKGRAFRVEHQYLCLACAQKLLESLPPAERDAFASHLKAAEPKKVSTVRIPAVRSTGDSGSHSKLRAPSDPTVPRVSSPPRSSAPLVAGLAGAAVLLVGVIVALSSSSNRAAPPPPAGAAPAPTAPSIPDPKDAEARRLHDQARAHAKSSPDDFAGQLDLLQKAAWKAVDTGLVEAIQRDMDAVNVRRQQRIRKGLGDLEDRVRAMLARGEFGPAVVLLKSELPRHAEQDWTLEIRRRIDAATAEARAAAIALRRQAEGARSDPAALRALRERTAALGFPEFLVEFDAAVSAAAPTPPEPAPSGPPIVIYDDALGKGWGNNSWNSEVDLKASAPVAQGACSIAWTPREKYAGLYLGPRGQTILAEGISAVSFRLYRAQERFPVALTLYTEDRTKNPRRPFSAADLPPVGQWKRFVVPLADLGFQAREIRGFVLQSSEPMTAPLAYVDEILLLRGSSAPPAPDASPPALAGEALAWRDRWLRAAALAAGRDYPSAEKELADGMAGLKDDAVRAEAARDLADLKAAGALVTAARQALAKWPRGMNLRVEIAGPDGGRLAVDEPVRHVEAERLAIRPAGELREVEAGEILADSLAALAGAKDPRAAALLCALEGDLDAARHRLGAEPPAAWRTHAAALLPEADERRLLREAGARWRDPAARVEAAAAYAALLREHAASRAVRRNRASIAERAEPPRDFFFATAELRASGAFAPARHPKGEIGWTMAEDVADRSRRPDHFVEVAYSAAPNAEIHAWVLAGACCAETWAFFVQATELQAPDPNAPTALLPAGPGEAGLLPVPITIPFLKRTHLAHGGPKAPTRFDWIALPALKHAQAGPKRLRVVSDQQGFTVVAVFLSASKRPPPREAELRLLEAGRPLAADLLEGGDVTTGGVLREVWTGIDGNSIAELTGSAAFRGAPAVSDRMTSFAAPRDWTDRYGTRLRGWVKAPATGSYVFWICTDDDGELWLGTNEKPTSKRLIAGQDGASAFGSWTQRPSQESKEQRLERGRTYYLEALQKEGGGNDHVLVGWRLPDGTLERPIPGARLVPWTPENARKLAAAAPTLGLPAAVPAGSPVVVTADSAGAARVEILHGTHRLGEAKGDPPTFTWAAPSPGAHLLSARLVERGGRSTLTLPALVVVGDLALARAVDLNGPQGRDRVVTTAAGWERSDLELRPPADPARAAALRSALAVREGAPVAVEGLPDGKALVYLLATEFEASPQAFDVAVNGTSAVAGHRFAAAGDWARLGPFPLEVSGGKLEIAVSRGVAYLAAVEVWSVVAPK
jgi:hypothetical protein